MWMMMMDGDNDRGRDQMKPPPKLRPLMPRPMPIRSSNNHPPYSAMPTPSCCCIPNPKTLSWNHSISAAAPLVSTRWNPTPEQLQALEEMYIRGIRTPSAEQIQQIAAKLRRFGKIEGKNVFYWFQNHKARERQKKRRQLELLAGKKQTAGLSRRYFEIEHHKKASNSSSTSSADSASISMHGAAIAADGWAHKELQRKLGTAENEKCWQLDLSSCFTPNSSSINAITAHKATGQENANPYASQNEENLTLQLFPTAAAATHDICTIPTKTRPIEFFEFLPIKD